MKRSTACVLFALAACDSDSAATGLHVQEVQAVCVEATASLPADAWLCGQPLTVQCGADLPPLYVRDDCRAFTLQAPDVLTDRAGTQTVLVTRSNGSLACSTPLTVAPGAQAIAPRVLNLWPPNHKLHDISVEDCIGELTTCDPTAHAEFIWGSSDEPVDARGDGHHAPDILFADCEHVQLRSERQGPKDGRVYKLGVRVTSGSGAATDSVCTVVVDHDQRGVLGADSGEAYRVTLDGTNGSPVCDGRLPPPVVVPDAGAPPVVLVPDASAPPVFGF
jgi:hypothetical protein